MSSLNVKVCGMKYAANIAAVSELQPNYLGFIFYPKSPRYINPISAGLIKYVPKTIKTVGVFVNEALETVTHLVQKHQLSAVQLHGSESPSYCKAIKALDVEIIKAFGINDDFDFEQLNAYGNDVDYFLFDTQTANHGGSGKVFDWQLLAGYKLNKPYFLSGGIGLNHVTDIKLIKDERLYAVDVNSKFEDEPGLKNVGLLTSFFEEINNKLDI